MWEPKVTKKRCLTLVLSLGFVVSLIGIVQLDSCYTLLLEADTPTYLNLDEIGVTVLIGPEKAMILLDISPGIQDRISLINYSMDEHNLVLKSPTQTRSIYVAAQLQINRSEIAHLHDRIRLVIHCEKPI